MNPIQYLIIIFGSLSSIIALIVAVIVIWNTNSKRLELYRRKFEAFNLQKTRIETNLRETNK